MHGASTATGTERWLFLGFFIAFAVKAPLWPFHTWLPDAAAGPAGARGAAGGGAGQGRHVRDAALLPASCSPRRRSSSRPLVIVLALVGIVYGALLAVGQTDMKRLVAYTSISHFGFIGIGIFAFTTQAGTGAMLYMVNHGFATGALFLVAGFLISRRGSRLITDFGGVQKVAPVLAGIFLIAGLASLALPGLAPFVSEFLVLLGTFTRYPVGRRSSPPSASSWRPSTSCGCTSAR